MQYARDIIDERDYSIEVLLWAVDTLPEDFIIKDNEIQNQSLQAITRMGCVFYAWSSISNTMNFLKGEPEKISGLELSKIAIDEWLLNINEWAYVSSSPKLLKKLGYIEAYWLCRTIEEVKLSIFNGKPVQTGSNKISWNLTRKNNNVAVGKTNSPWHSFFICGWNKEWFICENSYWEEKYNGGYFTLRYEDYNLLFNSKYAFTDTPNAQILYKKKMMEKINLEEAKEAFELWIWNGQDATLPVSREECATMILRAINNK